MLGRAALDQGLLGVDVLGQLARRAVGRLDRRGQLSEQHPQGTQLAPLRDQADRGVARPDDQRAVGLEQLSGQRDEPESPPEIVVRASRLPQQPGGLHHKTNGQGSSRLPAYRQTRFALAAVRPAAPAGRRPRRTGRLGPARPAGLGDRREKGDRHHLPERPEQPLPVPGAAQMVPVPFSPARPWDGNLYSPVEPDEADAAAQPAGLGIRAVRAARAWLWRQRVGPSRPWRFPPRGPPRRSPATGRPPARQRWKRPPGSGLAARWRTSFTPASRPS